MALAQQEGLVQMLMVACLLEMSQGRNIHAWVEAITRLERTGRNVTGSKQGMHE
jgi:hypothetical protein